MLLIGVQEADQFVGAHRSADSRHCCRCGAHPGYGHHSGCLPANEAQSSASTFRCCPNSQLDRDERESSFPLSFFSLLSLSLSLSSLCSLFKRGQVGCGGKRKRWICFSPLFFFFFCFTFLRVIDSATPSKSIQSQTPAKRKEVKNVVVFVEKGRW